MPTYEQENAVFESHFQEWMGTHPEEFVAIQGQAVLGFFPSGPDAYMTIVDRLGGEVPFLIRKVEKEEQCVTVPQIVIEVVR